MKRYVVELHYNYTLLVFSQLFLFLDALLNWVFDRKHFQYFTINAITISPGTVTNASIGLSYRSFVELSVSFMPGRISKVIFGGVSEKKMKKNPEEFLKKKCVETFLKNFNYLKESPPDISRRIS